MKRPKYPNVVVVVGRDLSRIALTYRVTGALRRAGVPDSELDAYAAAALESDTPVDVAREWVTFG